MRTSEPEKGKQTRPLTQDHDHLILQLFGRYLVGRGAWSFIYCRHNGQDADYDPCLEAYPDHRRRPSWIQGGRRVMRTSDRENAKQTRQSDRRPRSYSGIQDPPQGRMVRLSRDPGKSASRGR